MPPVIHAAQYLRMSTEHQQYSLENQSLAIALYAVQHGFLITKTYSDEARSGLVLRQRPGLQRLLSDVVTGSVDFKTILVYDVSRWGRFQDADESAHYEFLCKSAGVPVHFCAETFQNDNSGPSTIMKALKRAMAGEYSRELSAKVYAAQRRISELGFRTGGTPGYGFRRMLLSPDGTPRQLLNAGEKKAVQNERVILVHGPKQEIDCVREMFRMVVEEYRSPAEITRELNKRGEPFIGGVPWYHEAVMRILSHPKYCGDVRYGTRTQKLHSKSKTVPPDQWIISKGRHEPIVSREVFDKAQRIIHAKTLFKDDNAVLDALRRLRTEHGKLSARLISESKDVPSTGTFWHRFGGLRNAYQLIGYTGIQSTPSITKLRQTNVYLKRSLMEGIVNLFPGEVSIATKDWRQRPRLRLKDNSLVTVYLCRPHQIGDGSLRWVLCTSRTEVCKFTLIARLQDRCEDYVDFIVMPCIRRPTLLTLKLDDPRLSAGIRFTEKKQFPAAITALRDKLPATIRTARLYRPLAKS